MENSRSNTERDKQINVNKKIMEKKDYEDFYDEEPRPEDYFFSDEPAYDWKEEIKILLSVSTYRLYCFPRVGILTLGKEIIKHDPLAAVISISSSTDLCPELSELGLGAHEEGINKALFLKFDDIGPEGKGTNNFPPYPINEKQAKEIVEFIEKWINHGPVNFYIHCDAGVSRSQAVVKFILECFPDYPWQIFRKNPPTTPNAYVLSSLKRILWERKFNEDKKD